MVLDTGGASASHRALHLLPISSYFARPGYCASRKFDIKPMSFDFC